MRMVTNPTRVASEFAKRQTLRAIERTGYSLLKISHDTSERADRPSDPTRLGGIARRLSDLLEPHGYLLVRTADRPEMRCTNENILEDYRKRGNRPIHSALFRTLQTGHRLWMRRAAPWRLLLATRLNQPITVVEARELAAFAPTDYEAQMAAGRTMLYGSESRLSVIVESERCFRRAVELMPNSADAIAYLSFSLGNQSRWSEALKMSERALAIDPNHQLARQRHLLGLEELNLIDQPHDSTRTRSSYSRYPETIASLADLEQSVNQHVLNHVPKNAITLTQDSRVVTVGSCFAANLANTLTEAGITATNLTVGEIVNSTYANLEFFRWSFRESEVISDEMSWVNRDTIRGHLEAADLIIYTLGVAPCFFEKQSGRFVIPQKTDGIRGVISGKYVFRNTTVEENVSNLKAILDLIRRSNPRCDFVFSLSPVPLTATLEARSSMEADCLSKSILRVAVEQLYRARRAPCTGPPSRFFAGLEFMCPTCTGRKMGPRATYQSA